MRTGRSARGTSASIVWPNAAVVYAVYQSADESFLFLKNDERDSISPESIEDALASVGALLGLAPSDVARLLDLPQKGPSFQLTGMSATEFHHAVRCCAVLHGHLALEALPALQVPDLSRPLFQAYALYSRSPRLAPGRGPCTCRRVGSEPPPLMFRENFARLCRDAGFLQPEGPMAAGSLGRVWAAYAATCQPGLPEHMGFGQFLRALVLVSTHLKAEVFVAVAALGLVQQLPELQQAPSAYRYTQQRDVPFNLGGAWRLEPHLEIEALAGAVREGRQYDYANFVHEAQRQQQQQQQQGQQGYEGDQLVRQMRASRSSNAAAGGGWTIASSSSDSGFVVRDERSVSALARSASSGPSERGGDAGGRVAEGDVGAGAASGGRGGSSSGAVGAGAAAGRPRSAGMTVISPYLRRPMSAVSRPPSGMAGTTHAPAPPASSAHGAGRNLLTGGVVVGGWVHSDDGVAGSVRTPPASSPRHAPPRHAPRSGSGSAAGDASQEQRQGSGGGGGSGADASASLSLEVAPPGSPGAPQEAPREAHGAERTGSSGPLRLPVEARLAGMELQGAAVLQLLAGLREQVAALQRDAAERSAAGAAGAGRSVPGVGEAAALPAEEGAGPGTQGPPSAGGAAEAAEGEAAAAEAAEGEALAGEAVVSVEAEGEAAAAERAVAVYTLAVTTSELSAEGTDAAVYVTLYGSGGDTGELPLVRGAGGFGRGQTDTFVLAAPDVGELQRLMVRSSGTGAQPAWHLGGIGVASSATSALYTFPFDGWLDEARGLQHVLPCMSTRAFVAAQDSAASAETEQDDDQEPAAAAASSPHRLSGAVPAAGREAGEGGGGAGVHTGSGGAGAGRPSMASTASISLSNFPLPPSAQPSRAAMRYHTESVSVDSFKVAAAAPQPEPPAPPPAPAASGGDGGWAAAHAQLLAELAGLRGRVQELEAAQAVQAAAAAAAGRDAGGGAPPPDAAAVLARLPPPLVAAAGELAGGAPAPDGASAGGASAVLLLADLLSHVLARAEQGVAAADAAALQSSAAAQALKKQAGRLSRLQLDLCAASLAAEQGAALRGQVSELGEAVRQSVRQEDVDSLLAQKIAAVVQPQHEGLMRDVRAVQAAQQELLQERALSAAAAAAALEVAATEQARLAAALGEAGAEQARLAAGLEQAGAERAGLAAALEEAAAEQARLAAALERGGEARAGLAAALVEAVAEQARLAEVLQNGGADRAGLATALEGAAAEHARLAAARENGGAQRAGLAAAEGEGDAQRARPEVQDAQLSSLHSLAHDAEAVLVPLLPLLAVVAGKMGGAPASAAVMQLSDLLSSHVSEQAVEGPGATDAAAHDGRVGPLLRDAAAVLAPLLPLLAEVAGKAGGAPASSAVLQLADLLPHGPARGAEGPPAAHTEEREGEVGPLVHDAAAFIAPLLPLLAPVASKVGGAGASHAVLLLADLLSQVSEPAGGRHHPAGVGKGGSPVPDAAAVLERLPPALAAAAQKLYGASTSDDDAPGKASAVLLLADLLSHVHSRAEDGAAAAAAAEAQVAAAVQAIKKQQNRISRMQLELSATSRAAEQGAAQVSALGEAVQQAAGREEVESLLARHGDVVRDVRTVQAAQQELLQERALSTAAAAAALEMAATEQARLAAALEEGGAERAGLAAELRQHKAQMAAALAGTASALAAARVDKGAGATVDEGAVAVAGQDAGTGPSLQGAVETLRQELLQLVGAVRKLSAATSHADHDAGPAPPPLHDSGASPALSPAGALPASAAGPWVNVGSGDEVLMAQNDSLEETVRTVLQSMGSVDVGALQVLSAGSRTAGTGDGPGGLRPTKSAAVFYDAMRGVQQGAGGGGGEEGSAGAGVEGELAAQEAGEGAALSQVTAGLLRMLADDVLGRFSALERALIQIAKQVDYVHREFKRAEGTSAFSHD